MNSAMLPLRFLFPCLLLLPAFPLRAQEDARTGEVIYKEMCAKCHGDKGQGVEGSYDDELYGEKSIAALARLIDKTMPEDREDSLDAAGSAKVAEYIYHSFYSMEARTRNHPPRVELAHLTNRQYRESVADLMGSFVDPAEMQNPEGLKAEYFESDGMNKKAKNKLERVDAALAFDWGEGPPVEGCSAEQFSIAWHGVLLAQESGFYEFRLTTPNGARFYLNRDFREGDRNFRDDSDARRQPALIEEWVSSGEKVREATARVYLLGGRRYPLRLDYFKYKEKRGSVKLEWLPPHGSWEVLSAPHLAPGRAPRVSVTTTNFPPDDGSFGYERGITVSKDWHEATTRAAIEAGNEVTDRLRVLTKTRDAGPDKMKELGHRLAERAFRAKLTDEERVFYVDRHFTDKVTPEIALKRAVILILKSPRFLFPDTGGGTVDDWTVASRLALYLWDSLPDQPLREAAEKGELRTAEQVRAQAERMIQDSRAKIKLREFFHEWLSFNEAGEIAKDRKIFPEFDEHFIADLRTSLDAFVEQIAWSEGSDYRELLLADYMLLNPKLAQFYGATPPGEDKLVPVKFDPAQRAGVFTHPYLLAVFAHQNSTAPIQRGVFLTRNIMGRFLKPPPMAVAFQDEKFDPSLTMRQKVTELTRGENCMSCHATINPLGFSLEHFDAVGRWRTSEQDKPIDAKADYTTPEGDTIQLQGARDVAKHAAENREAQRGFVRQMFHYMVKQTPNAFGAHTLSELHEGFTKSGFHMRRLLAEITVAAARRGLPPG